MQSARFLWSAAVVVVAVNAHADAKSEALRTKLFQEGRAFAEQGNWEQAAVKFREVVAIRSAPRALVALAAAEEHLGLLTLAKRHYEAALADTDKSAFTEDERKLATDAFASLDRRIPRLTVRIPAGVDGARIFVDAKPMPIDGLPIELDPGKHRLEVEAPGRVTYRTTVALPEGARKDVIPNLPLGTPDAPPPPEEPPKRVTQAGPLVLGGAGLVVAGVGAFLVVRGLSAQSDVSSQCKNDVCPESLHADADSASRKIVAGDIVLGVGLAAVAGAGLWLALTPSSDSSPSTSTASIRVQPTSHGAWLGLDAQF